MKKITVPVLLMLLVFGSCSKVTQKRLEGSWKVREITDMPDNNIDAWANWLDTVIVKVFFYDDGSFREFYFQNDSLTGYSEGTYLLSEEDDQLTIAGQSILFNSHGLPLDVTNLQRKSMTLEGKYYFNFINPAAPADSVVTLRWELEK